MTRTRLLLLLSCLACAALLTGCPTDGRRDTFDYLRSPVTFRLDPVAADHPFCLDQNKRMGLTEQQCREATKYRLRWERPEDTVGFAEYRIYVDTTPPGSLLPWSTVQKEPTLASFVLTGAAPPGDSIIFILSSTASGPQTIIRGTTGIVPLDTTGRLEAGRLVFSIVTSYRESGLDGQPRYTWVITDDRFAPYPPQTVITPKSHSVEITWQRPRDPTSFFEPGADSGIILAYYLRVIRGAILHTNRPGNFDSVRVSYFVGGVDRTADVDSTHFVTPLKNAPGRLFRLPDSSRVRNRNATDPLDRLRVVLSGLFPQDTVDIGLWAVDAAGNVNAIDSGAFTRVLLTDTTQPTTPVLRLLDSSRNGFVYAFTASRDLVETGGGLSPAPEPNANILEYRVSRRLLNGTISRDTVITLSAARRGDTLITDTVRYLGPGSTYRLYVQAVDSSEHLSEIDSLTVSTLAPRFPGADSAATCPPGFIAVPGGQFLRGDADPTLSPADEKPSLMRTIQSFCIEPYEHRDSAGFKTRVTWEQARDICADMDQSLSSSDSTWLCTEAEWERACEGVEPDVPLTYGVQSEKKILGGVRFTCNVGTGDSVMAKTLSLRDPDCISHDGVFDLAGNLAEWVLDPYTSSGYPSTPDTLRRGTPHTAVTAGTTRGFRGSHYLNPGQAPSVLLARARCSNRDYATQSRPRAYAGCSDTTGPQIVVTYGSKPPRCFAIPDTIPPASIDTLATTRDSSQILILLKGVAKPLVFRIPADTAYAQPGTKPVTAGITQRTMAAVTFRNAVTLATVQDTLPAAELLGASPAALDAIFNREAAPPWAAVKQGGQYAIRYIYAHVQTRNVVAKPYYSNAAIGLRCCSRPRP